ncbi:MAG TPA: APC family permease [Actinomycetota bacterium]|nr:APC family permease [Actinomycetota bacterium]
MNRLIKRILVGKPVSTHQEGHHRLPKTVALAVFSSDALSSSAYATDEILLALILAGTAAISFALPIGIAVTAVLIIVITSYRQTVRAYPQGGGAYRVAHENLGPAPGLIAASSLLIDYVLTVSVSVAAGVAAIGAAFPAAKDHRVAFALGLVGFITFLNLRGLKESGSVFAVPTYGFLVTMGVMITWGVYKVLTGNVTHVVDHAPSTAAQSVSLFLILKAFAQGSTALTGVEAISDGVPAFRKPESKNAATTLGILGILLTFLFLGITYLAHEVGVDAHSIHDGKTVTSQIAGSVFGIATPMFYAVQSFTALILILAANTAYADFPRLASILARDRYLPRALQNRGDRLAFSNGIMILSIAAGAILWHFKANHIHIIPLYVVGVFTSFTLSQGGMVVRAFRRKKRAERLGRDQDKGWRFKALVSGIGALTTFLVLIIVASTKFLDGAWLIICLIPALAFILSRVKKHYELVSEELRGDKEKVKIRTNRVVLVVTRFRGSTKAMAFARAIGPKDIRAVGFRVPAVRKMDLINRWDTMGIRTPLEEVGSRVKDLVNEVKSMNPSEQNPVTVILPDPQYKGWLIQLFKSTLMLRLKRAFLVQDGVVVVSVPFQPDVEPEPKRLQAPARLVMIVVVSAIHKATLRALEYAEALNPSELKAMTIQTDSGEAAMLTEQWQDWRITVPLEIVDSPYRGLIEPLLREVREHRPNPNDAIGVVVPEYVVSKWWQHVLHNQTALLIKTALLFEPNVVVINVPYRIGDKKRRRALDTRAREDQKEPAKVS